MGSISDTKGHPRREKLSNDNASFRDGLTEMRGEGVTEAMGTAGTMANARGTRRSQEFNYVKTKLRYISIRNKNTRWENKCTIRTTDLMYKITRHAHGIVPNADSNTRKQYLRLNCPYAEIK